MRGPGRRAATAAVGLVGAGRDEQHVDLLRGAKIRRSRASGKARPHIPRPSAGARASRRRRRGRRSRPRAAPRRVAAIGISTPRARASSISAAAVVAPSASLPPPASATAAPLPERDAEREIARLRGRAGEHEIAEAREAHQRVRPRAERLAETPEFGEAARDQRRARAGAEPEPRRDAAGDREHVLRRAADLDAAHVGRMIEPQIRALQRRGRARPRAPRPRAASVTAVGRPAATSAAKLGPERIARGQAGADFGDDLGHEQVRAELDPLGADDERARRGERGREARRDFARRLRGRRDEDRARNPASAARSSLDATASASATPGRRAPRRLAAARASPLASRPQSATLAPALAAALASARPQAPAPATPMFR